jgi:hypothetical protein
MQIATKRAVPLQLRKSHRCWQRRLLQGRALNEVGQQAIVLVLGIVLLMATITAALVTTTVSHIPLISQVAVEHNAYRALEAGLNEYVFAVNSDPAAVTCNSTQYANYVAGTGGSVCSEFATAGIKFGQWNQINTHTGPNVAPEWFLFGNPMAIPNTSQTTNTASIRISVVGAAGYPRGSGSTTTNGTVQYQSANIALSPANGFLLNTWWTDFEVIDPFQTPSLSSAVVPQGTTTCPYFWTVNPPVTPSNPGTTNADACAGAPIQNSGGAAGDHPITATYTSNNFTYTSAASSLTQQIASTTAPSTSTVTASPASPVAPGTSVTYTATVTPSSATGTFAFADGGSSIAGCTSQVVSGGAATCIVSGGYSAQTSHVITATYSGNKTSSTSAASQTEVVSSAVAYGTTATTTTVTSSAGLSLLLGGPVIFTATVSPAGATSTTGIGFTDNGTAIAGCTARPITAGVATCQINTGLTLSGFHVITATYLGTGDPIYAPSAGSFAQPLGLLGVLYPTSTTSLATSLTPTGTGASITYTASVSPNVNSGTVKFTDNGASFGCDAQTIVSHNTATCTLPTGYATGGIHVITATYINTPSLLSARGDSAASKVETVQVPTQVPSMTIASSTNPVSNVLPSSPSITYTATLPAGATGTVAFTDGGNPIVSYSGNDATSTSICTAQPINSTKATCTVSGGYGDYGTQDLIQFITADQLAGPVYSNDTVFACGSPTFAGPLLVQDNDQLTAAAPGCSNGASTGTGSAKGVTPQTLPSTATFSNLQTTAAQQGCLYTGPTTITVIGATYSVTSPETPVTGTAGNYTDANNTGHGLTPDGSTCLDKTKSSGPATPETGIPLPKNGVIYVQSQTPCTATSGNPLDVPYPNHDYYGATSSPECEGDAIVQGNLSGQLTVVADNNVVVDNHLTYTDCAANSAPPSSVNLNNFAALCAYSTGSTNDVMGLIAQNDVEVNNPDSHSVSTGADGSTCTAGTPDIQCTPHNLTIDAAILALNHSFIVNNYDSGSPLGSLSVFGSIAQKYRGPVGTGSNGNVSTGFSKNYQWDPRLGILSPPSFLAPGTPSWNLAGVSVTVGQCVLQWPLNVATPPITQTKSACNLTVGSTAPGVP